HDDRGRRQRGEPLGDDHGPEAADPPPDDGSEEVGGAPPERREQTLDHAGARASARASTATAPRSRTTSGLASSDTRRSRRTCAARATCATAAATAPRSWCPPSRPPAPAWVSPAARPALAPTGPASTRAPPAGGPRTAPGSGLRPPRRAGPGGHGGPGARDRGLRAAEPRGSRDHGRAARQRAHGSRPRPRDAPAGTEAHPTSG